MVSIQTKIIMPSTLFNVFFNSFYALPKRFIFLLVTMLVATISPVHAEELVPDKFKIALGGYTLVRYDSALSLTEPNLGAGISINPEATLGLDNEQTVLRLTGHYRFSKKHALTYSWYSINSHGNKSIEEEIEWLDENGDPITIPVGASVDTNLDFDLFKVGYLWSFYHTDKVELGVGAGLHMTRIAVGLTTDTTSTGVDARDVSTTLPLPVFSAGLTYHVTPKFRWFLKAELFTLEFDDWEGTYTDSSLGMEYRAFKHVGLGIGLNSDALRITEDTSDYKFTFDSGITGLLIYAAAYF